MDVTRQNASASDIVPDLFSSLCSFVSFIANSDQVLTIDWKLTPTEASVLASLIISGAEIPHLTLEEELPVDTATQLGGAINCPTSMIHALSLGCRHGTQDQSAEELLRTLSVAASAALEQLSINQLCIYHKYKIPLCYSFDKLTALRSLTISAHGAYGFPIHLLAPGIGKLKSLESFDVSFILFSDTDARKLVDELRNLPLMSDLGICEAAIGGRTAGSVGSLVALGRIRGLRLSGNHLTEEEISEMVDSAFASRRSWYELEQLDLSNNYIGTSGGQGVANLVARSPRLRTLNLSHSAVDATFDFDQPGLSRSLEELDVTDCELSVRGVEALLHTLRGFAAMRVLRIGENSTGDLAREVAGFLESPGGNRLIELQIRKSYIQEDEVAEFARAFAKAYTLQNVDMSENILGPHGATALIDALTTASPVPMTAVNFSLCGIGDPGACAAGRLISRRGCRVLHLGGNDIHAAGAKAVADSVFASACTIDVLDLSHNPIRDEGVKYLLDGTVMNPMRNNRLVRELDIEETGMKAEGAIAVGRAVQVPDSLLFRLCVSEHAGDRNAGGVLEKVQEWEENSKPARNVILDLR